MKKVTDEQIIEAWKSTRNYAQVGRDLGIAQQTAYARVTRLMSLGTELPSSQPVGYSLTSERAREIGRLRKYHAKNGKSL